MTTKVEPGARQPPAQSADGSQELREALGAIPPLGTSEGLSHAHVMRAGGDH